MNKYGIFNKDGELYVSLIRGNHEGEKLVAGVFTTEGEAEETLIRLLNHSLF